MVPGPYTDPIVAVKTVAIVVLMLTSSGIGLLGGDSLC